jgi:CRISPR system Cascade subunit CasD
MRDYLLFRLYSPLAAWGDIAVGEYRPSFAYPSKSAVMGLIAASLGLRRDQEEAQRALTESYSFAVKVDAMGNLLRDYHTTQVPPARRGVRHPTRRSELAFHGLHTILSSRDYRNDALYTVALWGAGESLPYSLTQLREALKKPTFSLYLGRKSCPPSLPLGPILISSNTLRDAFEGAFFEDAEFLGDTFPLAEYSSIYWEGDVKSGFDEQHIITRRDDPVSVRRRQFAERREYYAGVTAGKEE